MSEIRSQETAESRRDFLKKAGTLAATAPAVAILLRASAASAGSRNLYSVDCEPKNDYDKNDYDRYGSYDYSKTWNSFQREIRKFFFYKFRF